MPVVQVTTNRSTVVLVERRPSIHTTNPVESTVVEPKITEIEIQEPVRTQTVETNRGPKGDKGDPGTSFDLELIAAANLSGHRVVKDTPLGAEYADSSVLSDANLAVGITLGATSLGNTATVRTTGPIEEPSWSWIPGADIFLSVNGQLTQTPPTTGFSLSLGYAITTTKIFVDIAEPIILA